jgi:hypothetical protein
VKIIRKIEGQHSYDSSVSGWTNLPDYVPDPALHDVRFAVSEFFNMRTMDDVIAEWTRKGLVAIYECCHVYREPRTDIDYSFKSRPNIFIAVFDNAASAVMFKIVSN